MTKVAFVSFRLKAQDGVSVEAEKWINVFEEWGCEVNRVAGYIPEPDEGDFVIPELNHLDPQVESFTARVFGAGQDRSSLDQELAVLSEAAERGLAEVFAEIAPDIVIAENVFSLPVNIPFTMALCRLLSDKNISCIAVHHDFYWEYPRFSRCMLKGLLASYFPASLPQTRHVTINSQAREALYKRTGIAATCIRNCFNFEKPRQKDDFNAGLRSDLGMGEEEIMFLQPTRAIERKGIRQAVGFVNEFAAASGRPSRLVVTGSCEDGYENIFKKLCRDSGANVLHVPGWLGYQRGCRLSESPYDVRDAYAHCNMVTFPSTWEGFGNPVLESVVHRKLLLVANYPVLDELRAYGFQFLSLDDHAVDRAMKLMEYPALMEEMVDRNFDIGRRHFSLENLREDLAELVSSVVLK